MRAIDADAIVVHKFLSEDYDPSENDAEKAYRKGWNDALDAVAEFQPSIQPDIVRCKDCKLYDGRPCGIVDWYNTADDFCSRAERRTDWYADIIRNLPSAEPEIIRCKDCAKREYCRTSTVWAVAPSDDWYCADAERRTGCLN